MRRRLPDEDVDRFRSDRIDDLEDFARKVARWAKDHLEELGGEEDPELPNGLHDRAADNWRPLLTIADQVGGSWPKRARQVALLLSGDADDTSLSVQLIADIRRVFQAKDVDRLSSKELCSELQKMEDRPWEDWNDGSGITQSQLAKRLNPFDISPRSIRIDGETPKGYMLKWFGDAFNRYPPSQSATPQQTNETNDLEASSAATLTGRVAAE